jgi:hypothetical protein
VAYSKVGSAEDLYLLPFTGSIPNIVYEKVFIYFLS